MLKRVFDGLFTAFALLLIIPTALVLASWNAIPGDKFYSLKSNLEDITLLAFSGTPLVPQVSVKFTNRRFNEATILLSKKGSTAGYDLLVAEAKQSQDYISKKKDNQSGVQLIKNIETYQKEIEQKKAEVSAGSGGIEPKTSMPIPGNIVRPVIEKTVTIDTPQISVGQTTGQRVSLNVPTEIVITHETPEVVIQKLEETDVKLEEIKQEVEKDNELNNNGKHEENNRNESDKDKKKSDQDKRD